MSHPFGDLLKQYIHRKHGLSQSKLAASIGQKPSVITDMCKGGRLSGAGARERVLKIIKCLYEYGSLKTKEEADELLNAAGMVGISNKELTELQISQSVENHTLLKDAVTQKVIGLPEKKKFYLAEFPNHKSDVTDFVSTDKKPFLEQVGLIRWLQVALRQNKFLQGVFVLAVTVIGIYIVGQTVQIQYGWAVKTEDNDDEAIILINNHIVHVNEGPGEADWVDIDPYLTGGNEKNLLTFVNLNGYSLGVWKFMLQHNGDLVWDNANRTEDDYSIGVRHLLQLHPNGDVEEIDSMNFSTARGNKEWSVQMKAKDIGVILINDVPVAGAYDDEMGEFGVVTLNRWLRENESNKVDIRVWNEDGPYSWDISFYQNEEMVWRNRNNGTNQIGEVFCYSFIIDELEQITEEKPCSP